MISQTRFIKVRTLFTLSRSLTFKIRNAFNLPICNQLLCSVHRCLYLLIECLLLFNLSNVRVFTKPFNVSPDLLFNGVMSANVRFVEIGPKFDFPESGEPGG